MLRAIVVATGLLPWLCAFARSRPSSLVLLLHTLCHQRPERTIAPWGVPMLVCSRCAGVYAGFALGALLPLPRRALPSGRAFVLVALALATLDVVTQDLGLHAPHHPTRLVTGLLLGYAGSAFMFGALRSEA